MDSQLKVLSEKLGKMTSEEAADWLLTHYPVEKVGYGDAITLISHRSWQRPEQLRLAKHYFRKLPFASSKPYESFASFMSIKLFLKAIEECAPVSETDRELLLYHLIPVLHKVTKSDSDRELVAAFISHMQ
ncbi:hypothetical protein [Luteibacter yeojuensis]